MRKRRKYRIAPDLEPYLWAVMVRAFWDYELIIDKDGQYWCQTNAPSDTFHRLVMRARCEKMGKEKGGRTYLTKEEADNHSFVNALFGEGTKAFSIFG